MLASFASADLQSVLKQDLQIATEQPYWHGLQIRASIF